MPIHTHNVQKYFEEVPNSYFTTASSHSIVEQLSTIWCGEHNTFMEGVLCMQQGRSRGVQQECAQKRETREYKDKRGKETVEEGEKRGV
jgi:hypothetical protein